MFFLQSQKLNNGAIIDGKTCVSLDGEKKQK